LRSRAIHAPENQRGTGGPPVIFFPNGRAAQSCSIKKLEPPMDADEHRSNQKSLFICVYLRSSAVKTLFSSCLIEQHWARRPFPSSFVCKSNH
jgi:hypothetical protein